MYWQDTSINQTNQLPLDINGNCIFEVPINTDKRLVSTKDGRHWGQLRESKRSGFSRDRYIATCRCSFECHSESCPCIIEFKKVNRRQFSLKGICKSCGNHSKGTSCEARKFWEFPLFGEKVFVKHFGQHSCLPVKPRHNNNNNNNNNIYLFNVEYKQIAKKNFYIANKLPLYPRRCVHCFN